MDEGIEGLIHVWSCASYTRRVVYLLLINMPIVVHCFSNFIFLALETVIYFEDKKGVILHVEDGQNAEAGTAVATNKF